MRRLRLEEIRDVPSGTELAVAGQAETGTREGLAGFLLRARLRRPQILLILTD